MKDNIDTMDNMDSSNKNKIFSSLKLGKHRVAVSTTGQEQQDQTDYKKNQDNKKSSSQSSTSNWNPELYVDYLTLKR
ncbi:unnamed protein product [Cunninghamella blakesleeana]